jgi:hypothetical protein
MKTFALAALLVMTSAGALHAATPVPACEAEIQKTQADWDALHLKRTKPGAMSHGVGPHEHVQAALDTMNYHMRDAITLCKAGKDHESLLHLDVVRAFLNLPEIQHPPEHHYMHHDMHYGDHHEMPH